MIANLLALALSAQSCPSDLALDASHFAAEIKQIGSGEADRLRVEGAYLHCWNIEIARPDGARYYLKAEDVQNTLELPLRSEGQMDAENLTGLPEFFNTSGNYVLSVWPMKHEGAYQKPLYQKQLPWQFPECSLTTYALDEWLLYLQRFDGTVVKTQKGYEKHLQGQSFESFDVSMSSCTVMGLSLKIKGLKADNKDRILGDAINILRQVDERFVDMHAADLKQLGEQGGELDISDEFGVTFLYGQIIPHEDLQDIKLSISLRL